MNLYISSYEYEDFKIVRKITYFKIVDIENKCTLIADIDIPIIGQKYGLMDKNINTLFLVSRVDVNSFYKLNDFPIDVHVLIPKNKTNLFPDLFSDMQHIAWACIYDNENDAEIFVSRPSMQ